MRPSDGIADLRRVGHASPNLFSVRSVASPDEVVRQLPGRRRTDDRPPAVLARRDARREAPAVRLYHTREGLLVLLGVVPGSRRRGGGVRLRAPRMPRKAHRPHRRDARSGDRGNFPDLGPCQTSDGTTTSSVDVIALATDSHGGAAIVETPEETIMLSGSAVTPKSAVRIARALRPV